LHKDWNAGFSRPDRQIYLVFRHILEKYWQNHLKELENHQINLAVRPAEASVPYYSTVILGNQAVVFFNSHFHYQAQRFPPASG